MLALINDCATCSTSRINMIRHPRLFGISSARFSTRIRKISFDTVDLDRYFISITRSSLET